MQRCALSEHQRALLTIAPLVLGEGRRLFPAGFPRTELTLTSARPSSQGMITATYRPART